MSFNVIFVMVRYDPFVEIQKFIIFRSEGFDAGEKFRCFGEKFFFPFAVDVLVRKAVPELFKLPDQSELFEYFRIVAEYFADPFEKTKIIFFIRGVRNREFRNS